PKFQKYPGKELLGKKFEVTACRYWLAKTRAHGKCCGINR
ncbi:MAG: hypothetical protein ACI9UN_002185, partial [Granulosicoccus sp.]